MKIEMTWNRLLKCQTSRELQLPQLIVPQKGTVCSSSVGQTMKVHPKQFESVTQSGLGWGKVQKGRCTLRTTLPALVRTSRTTLPRLGKVQTETIKTKILFSWLISDRNL